MHGVAEEHGRSAPPAGGGRDARPPRYGVGNPRRIIPRFRSLQDVDPGPCHGRAFGARHAPPNRQPSPQRQPHLRLLSGSDLERGREGVLVPRRTRAGAVRPRGQRAEVRQGARKRIAGTVDHARRVELVGDYVGWRDRNTGLVDDLHPHRREPFDLDLHVLGRRNEALHGRPPVLRPLDRAHLVGPAGHETSKHEGPIGRRADAGPARPPFLSLPVGGRRKEGDAGGRIAALVTDRARDGGVWFEGEAHLGGFTLGDVHARHVAPEAALLPGEEEVVPGHQRSELERPVLAGERRHPAAIVRTLQEEVDSHGPPRLTARHLAANDAA